MKYMVQKMSFKFSVVIPTYNAESFIEEQLQAVWGGTLKPDQIIISNNGSTDNTCSVVQKLQLTIPVLEIVDSSAMQGVNYARNVGIIHARHEHVLICDADDIVASTWAQKMIASLSAYDLVGSGHQELVYSDKLSTYVQERVVIDQPKVFANQKYLLGGNLALRKTVFETLGGFDCSYRGGHDEVDFCLRASRLGYTQGWISEPLIQYRQRVSDKALFKQFYNYGRTWVQLALNFSPDFDEYIPSFKLMARKLAVTLREYLLSRDKSRARLQQLSWDLGRLYGVFVYRSLGQKPDRVLVDR